MPTNATPTNATPTKLDQTHEWLLFGTIMQDVALCCKEHGIVGYPESIEEAIKLRDEHEANAIDQ